MKFGTAELAGGWSWYTVIRWTSGVVSEWKETWYYGIGEKNNTLLVSTMFDDVIKPHRGITASDVVSLSGLKLLHLK